MLHSIAEVRDYKLQATDGEFGEIKFFLFDDFDWVVRYAAIEVGSRSVLLAMHAFGQPDGEKRILRINLTREKIMNSPVLDLDTPVSRDIETQLSDYYEWPYYWQATDYPNTMPGDLTAVPLIDMQLDREEQEEERDRELIPQTGDTPHLRSTRKTLGSTLHTTNDDQTAGRLVDMIVRDKDWSILYMIADSGGLFPGKKVVVSPNWVEQVDEQDARIDISLSEETIRNSPSFKNVLDLTDDFQTRLRDYYDQT